MSTRPAESAADVPRDPSAYRPGIHFGERFKDIYDEYNRHLDDEIVRGCIERGDVTHRHDGVVYFRETFGGVTYRLVVEPEKREAITGYPIGIDGQAARASGRWSSAQIADIKAFLKAKPGHSR